MNTTVPFGPASLAGYGGALIAAAIAALEALTANGQTPGSVKWLAIICAALVAWTNHNRSTQAAAQAELPVVDELAPGTAPHELPAAIPKDGVDNAQVPQATA